jgi:hypothetical protein
MQQMKGAAYEMGLLKTMAGLSPATSGVITPCLDYFGFTV